MMELKKLGSHGRRLAGPLATPKGAGTSKRKKRVRKVTVMPDSIKLFALS